MRTAGSRAGGATDDDDNNGNELPIVSIVVPFFGLTNSILGILKR